MLRGYPPHDTIQESSLYYKRKLKVNSFICLDRPQMCRIFIFI